MFSKVHKQSSVSKTNEEGLDKFYFYFLGLKNYHPLKITAHSSPRSKKELTIISKSGLSFSEYNWPKAAFCLDANCFKSSILFASCLSRFYKIYSYTSDLHRCFCLLTGLNMVVDRLEHGCWQAWTWLNWPAWTWLLTGLNMVVNRFEHGWADQLEHGCWQAWTWLLTGLNMIELASLNMVELASLNTVELASMNNVVNRFEHGWADQLEHGCWQVWTWLLTGLNMVELASLNMVVDRLEVLNTVELASLNMVVDRLEHGWAGLVLCKLRVFRLRLRLRQKNLRLRLPGK